MAFIQKRLNSVLRLINVHRRRAYGVLERVSDVSILRFGGIRIVDWIMFVRIKMRAHHGDLVSQPKVRKGRKACLRYFRLVLGPSCGF